jgi:thiol-disulfide isomerase/thioredoxin
VPDTPDSTPNPSPDDAPATPPAGDDSKARSSRSRGLVRRVVYPVVVIAAIIGVIWWIEYRPSGDIDPAGARYGPIDLPSPLQSPGLNVSAELDAVAPDFLLQTLDGGEIRLSDYRGRPVVLNFWASWCPPCRQEMPQLVKAYERYRGDGLLIIGVNLQEGKALLDPFVKDFGISYPIAIDRTGAVGDGYRLLGLPTSVFIGRDGVIRSVFNGPFVEKSQGTSVQGAIDANELDKRIQAILN